MRLQKCQHDFDSRVSARMLYMPHSKLKTIPTLLSYFSTVFCSEFSHDSNIFFHFRFSLNLLSLYGIFAYFSEVIIVQ
jgi:hypothetical protein